MLRHRSRNNSPVASPALAARGLREESLTSLNSTLHLDPPSLPSTTDSTDSASPTPLASPAGLSRVDTTDTLLGPPLPDPSTCTPSSPSSTPSPSSVRSILWQLLRMGWPSATTCLIQNFIALSSTLFLGHVSATALGAATIGNMTCNLTGFSVGLGFTTCLDALCSQAYGGRQYHLCGLHAQKGLVMMTLACAPVALVWSQTRAIVALLGVDEETAAMAQQWADYLTFGMPAFFYFECIRRWLQAQRIVWPVVVSSLATIAWNLLGNSLCIYRLNMGFQGPAIVMASSLWIMFLSLATCAWGRQRWVMQRLRQMEEQAEWQRQRSREEGAAKPSSSNGSTGALEHVTNDGTSNTPDESTVSTAGCQRWSDRLGKKAAYTKLEELSPPTAAVSSLPSSDVLDGVHDCWPPLSWAIFSDWSEHFRLGLPGAMSLFLEWGSYEVSASLAATLGRVPLAAHSIYMSTVSLWYTIPLGFSNATAAIIGNQLGAGEARLASTTARVAMVLCLMWGVCIGAVFFLGLRSVWGQLFIEDALVRRAVEDGFIVLWLYAIYDSAKCCLMAVLRGCGRPLVTVHGNIVSCCLVGYPLAFLFLFRFHLGLVGLWSSMTAAWFTATVTYTIVIVRTDWDEECRKANARNERGCVDVAATTDDMTPGELDLVDLHGDEVEEGGTFDAQTEEGMHGKGGSADESEEEEEEEAENSSGLSGVEDAEVGTVFRRSSHRGERDVPSTAIAVA